MNEASKLVSDSLLGLDFKIISMGGKPYKVYPPTIKTICRALSQWSKVGVNGEYSKISVLSEIPENNRPILNGLLWIIARGNWLRYQCLKMFINPKPNELREGIEMAIDLMGGDDFFACAALVKQATQIAAKQQ